MSTLLIPSCKSISVVVVFRQDAAVGDTKQNKAKLPTLSHRLPISLRQEAEQRTGNGESQGPRLARPAATAHLTLQVEAAQHAHELQREHQLLSERYFLKKKRRRENDQEIIR